MTEQIGIKETLELLDGVELLAVTGVAIAADKKVSASDLTHIVNLAKNAGVLVEAVKGIGELPAEVKDIDQQELMQLGMKAFEMAKSIKTAYEANKVS